jgi:uncharacterized 2Fe-2S/4Fe-4S cluster protein (DUF4445 family)
MEEFMVNITVKNDQNILDITVSKGSNLYAVLAQDGLIDNAPCGGKGLCGKCKVKIIENCPDATDAETSFLSKDEVDIGFRLACMIDITRDIVIETNNKLNTYGGITRLNNAITPTGLYFALDIGTTTLEGVLIDVRTKTKLIKMTKMNPQKKFGADVFTRLNYSLESENNKSNLKQVIMNEINDMVNHMVEALGVDEKMIEKATISANTTMIHMLLGKNVEKLSFSPFITDFLAPKDVKGCDVGFVSKQANINMSAAASAFIGGDITAGAVSMDIDKSDDMSLFIDLGTNGEMIFANHGSFVGCSVAAGPAFEGAEIECGMSALSGAITDIGFKNDLTFTTIDHADPVGICGSGLIDIIAFFVENRLIEQTGRLVDEHENEMLNKRLRTIDDAKCFVIYENDDVCIYISQRDIRNFQLAKAAIKTGIEMLIEKQGADADHIDTIYIAGGFGSHISSENLFKCGLMPFVHKNIKVVGNTSLKGSIKSVCDDEIKARITDFSKKVEVFLLAEHPNFQMLFVDNMMF